MERSGAHYRIGPLTTYADPGELERRFRRASAGDRLTYAIGPALGAGAATAQLARRWHEQGLVHLSRERDGKGWRYFIEKRPAPPCESAKPNTAAGIAGRPEEQLLLVLIDFAGGGEPLPSLELLAERAGLPHRQAADYRLRLLLDGGYVRIRRDGDRRFVDILKPEAVP